MGKWKTFYGLALLVWKPPTFLLLFFCWSSSATINVIKEDQMKHVTDNVRDTYKITLQHAYTIVFTSSECNSLTKDVIDKALIGDKRNNVRNQVLKHEIYEGPRLIMASYKEKVGSVWEHAEYRLLHKPSVNTLSPVEKLLNKNPKDGCALFFTLNSPCQQYCTNTTGKYDIIKDLDQFNKINSAAFVFHKVYEEKRVTTCCSNSLKPIDEKVPVYRCNDKCHKCVNNKVFNAVCLKKTTW